MNQSTETALKIQFQIVDDEENQNIYFKVSLSNIINLLIDSNINIDMGSFFSLYLSSLSNVKIAI